MRKISEIIRLDVSLLTFEEEARVLLLESQFMDNLENEELQQLQNQN